MELFTPLKDILPKGDCAIFIVTPDDGCFVEEIRKHLIILMDAKSFPCGYEIIKL